MPSGNSRNLYGLNENRAGTSVMITVEQMQQWIYATARSFAESGLTLEEYNAITKEVCDAFVPKKPRDAR